MLGLAVWYSIKYVQKDNNSDQTAEESPQNSSTDLKLHPLTFKISPNLVDYIDTETSLFKQRFESIQKQLSLDFGIFIPSVHIQQDKKQIENGYQILIYGSVVARGNVIFSKVLAINASNASMSSLEGVETKEPTYGLPAIWIEATQKKTSS